MVSFSCRTKAEESIKQDRVNVKICVVVPVHNESLNVADVVQGVKASGLDIVVIDDGSGDGSGNIARLAGATVLTNPTKQGKGKSLQRGFQFSLEHGYDGVIAMDGDGQHAVADLEKFLSQSAETPQSVIVGTRMQNSRGMPLIRLLTNRLMSGLISCLCRQDIPDSQCGYRYISCTILKDIQLTANDFEIESEVLIKASKKGYKISSVPIQTIYRNEKSKIRPLKDTGRFIAYIIREGFHSQS